MEILYIFYFIIKGIYDFLKRENKKYYFREYLLLSMLFLNMEREGK